MDLYLNKKRQKHSLGQGWSLQGSATLEKSVPVNTSFLNLHFYSVGKQTSSAPENPAKNWAKATPGSNTTGKLSLEGAVTQQAQRRPAATQKLDET